MKLIIENPYIPKHGSTHTHTHTNQWEKKPTTTPTTNTRVASWRRKHCSFCTRSTYFQKSEFFCGKIITYNTLRIFLSVRTYSSYVYVVYNSLNISLLCLYHDIKHSLLLALLLETRIKIKDLVIVCFRHRETRKWKGKYLARWKWSYSRHKS